MTLNAEIVVDLSGPSSNALITANFDFSSKCSPFFDCTLDLESRWTRP